MCIAEKISKNLNISKLTKKLSIQIQHVQLLSSDVFTFIVQITKMYSEKKTGNIDS